MALSAPSISKPLRIVIIGGQAAGMSAASKARRIDPEAIITIFEQTDALAFGPCGLPYFIGDFFVNPKDMMEFTPEQFAQRNLDIRLKHQVVSVDPQAQSVRVESRTTGEIYDQPYDRLLIATGASPIVPPVEGLLTGLESDCVYHVKTLADGLDIKERINNELLQDVVIIGAGYIGLEMVEAAIRQGKRVRIFDIAERPLATTFDEPFSQLVHQELLDNGVNCHWQENIQGLVKDDQGRMILETNKGNYLVDLMLLCTGAYPNTSRFQNLGLTMLSNGAIVVDDQAQTCLPHIFAAGDCAAVPHGQTQRPVWLPLATYANKLGRIAGEAMVGGDRRFPGAYRAICVKVMGLEAGRVGLCEQEAQAHGMVVQTVTITDKDHDSYYPSSASLTIKLTYDPDTRKILGGQIAGGRGAVLRVNVICAAIKGGLTTEDLGLLDLCYSPPFARIWDALHIAGNRAK